MSGCNCGATRAERLNPVKPGKLGRCRFCIYSSLALAVSGWAAYTALAGRPGMEIPGYAVLAVALAATLLFAAHIGVIVLRQIERAAPTLPSSQRRAS
jgi:hypothetical protein